MNFRRECSQLFLFLSLAGAVFLSLAPVMSVEAAGIVPCGQKQDDQATSDSNESAPCTLCHLVIGFRRLIDWGMNVMTFFALAILTAMGILYVVSTGNEKIISTAKEGIKATLYGFVLMLVAWVIVNFILSLMARNLSALGVTTKGWFEFTCSTKTLLGSHMTSDGSVVDSNGNVVSGGSTGGGSCAVVHGASEKCAVENMPKDCFGGRSEEASRICNFESGGKVNSVSGTDICQDGSHFSHGLWQINLVTSGNLLPSACQGVFAGNMDCIERTKNSKGVSYCSKRKCWVKDSSRLASCLQAVDEPATNTGIACKLYNGSGGFGPWPHTIQTCGIHK